MTRAYILIQTEVSAQAHVAQELEQIPGVSRATVVTGPYDVVALVTASDMDALRDLVIGRIQALSAITRSLTCPIGTHRMLWPTHAT